MKACLQLVQTTPCQMKGVKSIVQQTSHVDIGCFIDNDTHNVLLKLQILEEYSKTREISPLRLKKLFHSHDKQLSAPRVQVFRFQMFSFQACEIKAEYIKQMRNTHIPPQVLSWCVFISHNCRYLYWESKSDSWVIWSCFKGESVNVMRSLSRSSRRTLRAIGRVLPLSVPVDTRVSFLW